MLRRLISVLVVLVPMGLWAAAPTLAAGDANEGSCPASTEASPGFRAYLPDCRAYEMVSPPFKGGWRVVAQQFALDGSRVVGVSFGAFAGGTSSENPGNPYQFFRSPSGWITTPLNPPIPPFGEGDTNPTFGSGGAALITTHRATQSDYEDDLYLRQPDGSFTFVGPMLSASSIPATPTGTHKFGEGEGLAGVSRDLSHILFSIRAGGQPLGIMTNLWPGDVTKKGRSLYEYLGVGHTGTGSDVPSLVGVDNTGSQISGCGTSVAESPITLVETGVSSGGATVFFTANAGGCAGGGTGPAVGQLYARVGDPGSIQATVNVAGSSGCAASTACDVTSAPVYQGASSDGSRVFFTTTQPLSSTDHDTTTDIYECDVPGDAGSTPTPTALVNPCPSLNPVSVTGTGAGARVLSVRAISQDGSHVYFTAAGVLTGAEENQNHEKATEGADNFYAYERDGAFPAGHTSFIGKLTSSTPVAQTTSDGRFLVFTDKNDLTPDDTSTALQVFEYDAQTGRLVRISIGDQGFNNDGNTNVDPAHLPLPEVENVGQSSHPGVSSDGSKVVFTSSNGLTPQALNDAVLPETETSFFATNVYEYSGGRVYLISDGRAANVNQDTRLVGIDGSGRDIFFGIVDQLVPQDTDQLSDVYDAREEGGFPAPVGSVDCKGGECQGPLSGIPSLLPPGSSTFSGPGNPKPTAKQLTRAQKLSRALKACRRQPKRKRAACIRQAQRRYGARSASAKRSDTSKHGNRRGR